ncbi:methionine--tRNA ligase [Microlunatus parietis]|uniref:Methionine--tRNA ligase n=1 Tax=Microlunatus parietis TaxID=682979 RepID=A0A7Y9I260_9ACTN|nr:methionine--tRNA ligase [Microlunatus parietis]NYE68742.1 methionyl-tRNA synthetase [Microlunatus parietis]
MTVYLTTSIPYVNARPHLGHALEFVQADVLARHHRHRGRSVRLLSGTDDNALKNVTAARQAGVDPATFVAENADAFQRLAEPLGLSLDDFIRTGSDPRHAPGVQRIWRRCAEAGDFTRRTYRGLYCAGCEQFYVDDDLVDGRCPEHGVEPEPVEEENWFFALSRYAAAIRTLISSGEVRIEPEPRRNEILGLIDAGLPDVSVSRPAARADGWGIGVPGDPGQVIYVWWDALANYLTSLGYADDGPDYRRWWQSSAERIHVIGKGIVRFHALTWLGQLLSAGLPLPTAIFVHDYLTVDGAKISKSTGGSADPAAVVDSYGADAVRWWLAAGVARIGDTDFTERALIERHDSDLANGVGNLVNRTVTLINRRRSCRLGSLDPDPGPAGSNLLAGAEALPGKIDAALARFDLRAATTALIDVARTANRYLQQTEPWRLPEPDPNLDLILATALTVCRTLATELTPFVPDGADRLHRQLGTGHTVGTPEAAFPQLAD